MSVRILCVCSTVLAITGVAAADCVVRQRVVVAAKPVAAAVVKKEVAVVTPVIAPIAVYAPIAAYAAVYTPPAIAPAPAPDPTAAQQPELKAILDAIQAMDRRLQALEGRGGATPPKGPDPFNPGPRSASSTAPPGAFQAKCAGCHESKVALEKGGGFTLLEGSAVARLTDRQMRKLMSVAYAGTMPPRGKGDALTDEEVGQIMSYLDGLK